MRDALDDIRIYYDSNSEELRPTRQQLEYHLTLKIFDAYLPADHRILELGAATGAFTGPLAARGNKITAVDLNHNLLKKNKEFIAGAGLSAQVKFITADARDIDARCEANFFDSVVMMGPAYHLENQEERFELFRKIKNLVKPGGLLFSSHMLRSGFMGYMVTQHPEWISPIGNIADFWTTGRFANHPRNGTFRGYWTTIEEMVALHRDTGWEITRIHAQDPHIGGNDIAFNKLDDAGKANFTELFFCTGAHSDSWGSARHLMAIAKRI